MAWYGAGRVIKSGTRAQLLRFDRAIVLHRAVAFRSTKSSLELVSLRQGETVANESVSHPRRMRKIGHLAERETKGYIMGTWWEDKITEGGLFSTSCFKTLHVLADSILLLDDQIANPGL